MKMVLTPPARAELDDAAAYYETRRPGLGAEFIYEFGTTFNRIKTQPKAGMLFRDIFRFHMLNRFPYTVYYTEMPQEIIILAVAHQHSQPGYWIGNPDDSNINEPALK